MDNLFRDTEENIQLVKKEYPEAHTSYDNEFQVLADYSKSTVLGSGSTLYEAWREAVVNVCS